MPDHLPLTVLLFVSHLPSGCRNNTCFYNSSIVRVQRENGTLSKHDGKRNSVADLMLLKDPGSFLLVFFTGNDQEKGMSFYTDKPKASPEQLEEFYEALTCLGMNKTEVVYTDWKEVKPGGRAVPIAGNLIGPERESGSAQAAQRGRWLSLKDPSLSQRPQGCG